MRRPRSLAGPQPKQMLRGADHWRTVLDGAIGVDVYSNNGVAAGDFNNDGFDDFYACQPAGLPNRLYRNRGDGTFEDQSYVSGFAFNKDGREIASMGIAVGDYENNGLIDFFVTDFGDDYKVLYHNDGDASFSDVSYKAGVAQATIPFVGWGDGFLDYDNDGWLDLFMVNGHVYPEVDQHDWGTTFAERSLLFHNVPDTKGRKFEYVPAVKGTGLAAVIPAAFCAMLRQYHPLFISIHSNHPRELTTEVREALGRLADAGIPLGNQSVLLRNVNPDHHHWVEIGLVGGVDPKTGRKSPRDATCATVFLAANGMRQRQDVLSSGSYISANDRRLHFGLGDATDAGTAEIHWPSGAKEFVKLPAEDRIFTVTEGQGITAALCGGNPCAANASVPQPASAADKALAK